MRLRFSSVALVLALCGTAFAGTNKNNKQCACFYQGEMLTDDRYGPAYNAPAKIDLHDGHCKWPDNVFIDASFIYWYAAQEGMFIAGSADLGVVSGDAALLFNNGAVSLTQPFSYSPGFKVGIGAGVGEWELSLEYTWYRQKTSVNSNAPTDETTGGGVTPVWVLDDWFAEGINGNSVSATHVSSSWHLGMDRLDLTAGRPYYQSKNSTVSPFGGARALWIRQALKVGATVPTAALVGSTAHLVPQPIHSRSHSNSWGVGPVVGAMCNCLLGQGFRLEGEGSASILFTQYTTIYHSEDDAIVGGIPVNNRARITNYNCVRPAVNLGLGLGWGTYFYEGSYHVDFSADYEFNVLWDQNMMRLLAEKFAFGSTTSGDLFLHGLTVKARFDF